MATDTRSLLLVGAVLAALLVLPATALGATNTFTGSTDSTWNVAANWTDGIPTSDDAVIITNSHSVTLSAGADAVANSITLNGGLTVNGRILTVGAGVSTIANEVLLTGGATVALGATTTWSAGGIHFSGGGGTVQIGSGDVLNITGNGVASLNFNGGLWRNAGTVNRTTSATNALIGVPFENDGNVNVNTGTLSLGQGDGAGSSSGTFVVASGATLAFTGGDVQLAGAGARIGGPGTARFALDNVSVSSAATFDPATLEMAGGTLALDANATVTSLNATAGTRSGAGTLTVSGVATLELTLNGTGTTNLTGSAQITGELRLTGGHTLNMPPTATWSAGGIHFSGGGGTVQIGSGDVLNITGNGVASLNFNGGLWRNAGTVNRTTSATNALIGVPFENDGNVNVDVGTLEMGQGLTQTAGASTVASGATLGGTLAIQGGVLQGAGTAGGNVTNSGGTVRPGSSPGKLTIAGDYTQGAGGTLQVEISGTGQGTTHDWLAVGGNASLNGTLAIVDGPSFDPALSDTFDVLTATGTVSGTFATLAGAAVPTGTYAAQYTTGPPGRARLALAPVAAPVNTAAPSVASSAQVGDTLTCDPGSWSGSPTFAFRWMRDGAAIVGATSNTYATTDADAGTAVSCQVTATNAGGSASADSNAAAVAAPQPPPPPPTTTTTTTTTTLPPAPKALSPSAQPQTIRGTAAFTQGTAEDLYLACTRLDLTLVDVLPAAARRVSVTGAADLRLAGQTADILLDGKRVATAVIAADGSFASRAPAPTARRRARARYQARVGATRSQRLLLQRRMVATTLTRSGGFLVLRGRITRPFSRRAPIEVERFLSCRRRERVRIARVVPSANGSFAVRIPVPSGAAGAMYRARTRVPRRPGGPLAERTFTLPRAVDLR